MSNWTIHKHFKKHCLSKEASPSSLSIRRQEKDYCVLDDHEELLYRIHKSAGNHLDIAGAGTCCSGCITLADRSAFTRPPMVEKLTLNWNDSTVQILQNSSREFSFIQNGWCIGNIRNMATRISSMTFHDSFSDDFAALLYTLAWMMFREDDVVIL